MNPKSTIYRPLAVSAVLLTLALAPGFATAQQRSGDATRDRTQTHDQLQTPDRLQTRDQDRIHQDTTASTTATQDRLQTRLRDMDRTRDRIHQEQNAGTRAQLREQYRKEIQQGMDDLQNSAVPGPKASEAQRLQHMEQHMQQMQEMMQHSWEYQNQTGASTGN